MRRKKIPLAFSAERQLNKRELKIARSIIIMIGISLICERVSLASGGYYRTFTQTWSQATDCSPTPCGWPDASSCRLTMKTYFTNLEDCNSGKIGSYASKPCGGTVACDYNSGKFGFGANLSEGVCNTPGQAPLVAQTGVFERTLKITNLSACISNDSTATPTNPATPTASAASDKELQKAKQTAGSFAELMGNLADLNSSQNPANVENTKIDLGPVDPTKFTKGAFDKHDLSIQPANDEKPDITGLKTNDTLANDVPDSKSNHAGHTTKTGLLVSSAILDSAEVAPSGVKSTLVLKSDSLSAEDAGSIAKHLLPEFGDASEKEILKKLKASNSLREKLTKKLREVGEGAEPSELAEYGNMKRLLAEAKSEPAQDIHESEGLTIFDVVRAKYKEKTTMMSGIVRRRSI